MKESLPSGQNESQVGIENNQFPPDAILVSDGTGWVATTDIKEQTMSQFYFKAKYLCKGRDIEEMNVSDIVAIIAQAEAELKALNELETRPRIVTRRIKRIKKELKRMTKYLDNKHPKHSKA